MKTRPRTHKCTLGNCRGQALVEFAVTIIALLALVFGVVEISRIMLVYTTVANAARIGARYAIANSTPPGTIASPSDRRRYNNEIRTVVMNFAAAGTLNSSNLTVRSQYPMGTTPGNPVSVTVSYIYDPLLSYFSLGTIKLTSTSEGVITW